MKRALTMFAVTAAASVALSTAGWAQNPQAFMGWGTCPAPTHDMTFTAAQTYQLYIGAKNLTASDANVGYDINLFIGRGIPDAWRVDDAGCNGGTLGANHTGNASCTKGVGLSPLDVVAAQFYTNESPNDRMNLHLTVTSNNFTPVAGTTYLIWNLIFDHSGSVAGAGTGTIPNCGGADKALCIAMTDPTMPGYEGVGSGVLALTGIQEPFTFATATDGFVTWNGGGVNCPGSVPTLPSTWGKLKSLYH
jgi:hypothetical protein